MDPNEFREFGHASIDFIINYLENIRERNVLPTTTPFSLVQSLPKEIPEQAEHWKTVLDDLESLILPSLAHWQSPHFHGFFPSSSSAGSIIGELLIAGIGVLGFSWIKNFNLQFIKRVNESKNLSSRTQTFKKLKTIFKTTIFVATI